MHHHDMLSSEPLVAHSSSVLAAVWYVDVPAIQLRCRLRSDNRVAVDPSAEGLLLCNGGTWLRDYSFAGDHSDGPTHSVSHTSAHAAGHSPCDSAHDPASGTAHSSTRTC